MGRGSRMFEKQSKRVDYSSGGSSQNPWLNSLWVCKPSNGLCWLISKLQQLDEQLLPAFLDYRWRKETCWSWAKHGLNGSGTSNLRTSILCQYCTFENILLMIEYNTTVWGNLAQVQKYQSNALVFEWCKTLWLLFIINVLNMKWPSLRWIGWHP